MIIAAVFLLSVSSMIVEVLLTRIFSIAQWNHLSFMVISIALFGFGAGGTFLSILDTRRKGWETRLGATFPLKWILIGYTVSVITAFISLINIPLDYFRMPHEPIQALYLLAAYLILTVPFLISGVVISLAFAGLPERTGLIYLSTMTGSALGAIAVFPLVPLFGEERLMLMGAMLPLVLVLTPSPVEMRQPYPPSGRRLNRFALPTTAGAAVFAVCACMLLPGLHEHITVRPSAYKSLSQLLKFPDTRIIETFTDITGRIDRVDSPFIRFAPGLSLTYSNPLPRQWAAFTDADHPFIFYDPGQINATRLPAYTLSYAGYLLAGSPGPVLIIEHGGGTAIPCAITSGTQDITVIEKNPRIARMIRNHYRLTVINEPPRSFLARSDARYDVIQVESWGTSIPGAGALNQEHLFTIDACTEYLNHLTDTGVVIISRKLLLPPSDSIRLWCTAVEGLKRIHADYPAGHVAMLRNWDCYTLLITRQPLHHSGILEQFARQMNFDVVYLPDMASSMPNIFNVYNEPYHYNEINRLARTYQSGSETDYFRRSILDVSPQTDQRPFPGRFMKWTRLGELYQSTGSRFYSLMMSGEIVVAVVFAEAVVVSLFLLVLPLFAARKTPDRPTSLQLVFFLSLGAGYMFIELFFIHAGTTVFDDPVISFAVILSGILIFSGAGGYVARFIGKEKLITALAALICLLLLTLFIHEPVINLILRLSTAGRYLASFLLLLPVGVLMGIPFSIAMQFILQTPLQRAYAWAANGCASVLTSILSAQIALSLGITAIMECAMVAYLAALFCIMTGMGSALNR